MNILVLNYEYPPIGGGASNASFFLSKALVKNGHTVTVITSSFKTLRGYSFENNIHVYRVPSFRKSADQSNIREMFSFILSARWNASIIIRKQKIEKMIVFFTIPSGLVAPYIKNRFHVPYIISLRGGDVPGLVPELSSIHKKIKGVRQRILRKAIAVVANSKGLAELSEKTDPFPVKIIPNGVDVDFFCPQQKDLSENGIVKFLFVGRFQPQKNLFFLLEQFKFFSEKKKNIKLVIVGDGPQKKELQQFSKEQELENIIEWKPWLSKQELLTEYQQADCFINPSLYEGMPNVVLEAMACGLPVIASNIMGNNDLVKDGYNGYLFPLEDLNIFQLALKRIFENKENRKQMGINARDHVMKNYSWGSVANSYEYILNE